MRGEIRFSEDVAKQLVNEYGEEAVEEYRELMPDTLSECKPYDLSKEVEEITQDMHPHNLSSGVEGIKDVEKAVEQYRETALRYVLEAEVKNSDIVLE